MPLFNSIAGHKFTTEGQGLSAAFSNLKLGKGVVLPLWMDRFTERVLGLVAFALGQISGPSGVHGHFVERNIEALTLDVSLSFSGPGTNIKIEDSVDAVIQTTTTVLELQSRLHEELHHSLFYYLLMGRNEFVVCRHSTKYV